MSLFAKCQQFIVDNQERLEHLNAYFLPIEETDGTEVVVHGRRVIMAGSNSYLGLSTDPRVKEAAIAAVRRFGSSTSGSRLLNGSTVLHQELEERLAHFLRKEAVTLFSTGFQSNQGVLGPLLGRGDVVFTDRQVHASIVEGVRLGWAEHRKFRHNDMADLGRLLAKADPAAGKLIVVDGVYSMEGDIAPLDQLVALKQQHGAHLMVDDAHGLGVLGEGGRGTAEHFGLEDEVDLIVGTFSKSFGSLGGMVAGPAEVIQYLKYNSRALIFSASMTPAAVGACLKSLEIMETEPERRVQLLRNAARLRSGLKAMGFQTIDSHTPIVPVVIGGVDRTLRFFLRLLEVGVFTNPVLSPAVPPGMELIRTSLMATHTDAQIDRIIAIFSQVGRELGVQPAPPLVPLHR